MTLFYFLIFYTPIDYKSKQFIYEIFNADYFKIIQQS